MSDDKRTVYIGTPETEEDRVAREVVIELARRTIEAIEQGRITLTWSKVEGRYLWLATDVPGFYYIVGLDEVMIGVVEEGGVPQWAYTDDILQVVKHTLESWLAGAQ